MKKLHLLIFPIGWDVENGDPNGTGLKPDTLVSLTAPKTCSQLFTGRHHYLGLRMVPRELASQYKLDLPPYPGTDQIVRLWYIYTVMLTPCFIWQAAWATLIVRMALLFSINVHWVYHPTARELNSVLLFDLCSKFFPPTLEIALQSCTSIYCTPPLTAMT